MLGLGRRRQQAAVAPARIEADLAGAVIAGQVAVGEHIVQIHAEHGAIVNYTPRPPAPRRRPGPVRRLPRPFDGLVGRMTLLDEVHRAVAGGEPTELVGEAGAGKTALLRNLANHLAELPPDGAVYARAAGLPAADVLQLLFETFYDCDGAIVLATHAQLIALLGGIDALVLIDDFDGDRDELGELLSIAARATIVSASPSRRLFGEGTSLAVPGLTPAATAELLERELQRALSPAERAMVERVCRSLGATPLRTLQVATLLGDPAYADGATAITAAPGELDRLLTRGLSDEARRIVAPLAAAGGAAVPTGTVAAVSGIGAAADVLAELERHHLVGSHSPRYTVRAEVSDPAQTHRAYTALVAAAATPEAMTPELLLALGREARRRHAGSDVLALARAADGGLALSARWGAWGELLEGARAVAHERGALGDEAWALHQLGSRALGLGDRAAAARLLHGSLALRERIGDRAGAQVTRHNLDQLAGPAADGSSGGGPAGPGPGGRLRVLAAIGVAVLAAAVVVGLEIAGHRGSTHADNAGAPSPVTRLTTPASPITTQPSRGGRATTTHRAGATHGSPPALLALGFDPNPVVVLVRDGSGRHGIVVTNEEPFAVSLTVVSSAAGVTGGAGSCAGPVAPRQTCTGTVIIDNATGRKATLTWRTAGPRSAKLPVVICTAVPVTTVTTSSGPTGTPTSTQPPTTTTTTTNPPVNAIANSAAPSCPQGFTH